MKGKNALQDPLPVVNYAQLISEKKTNKIGKRTDETAKSTAIFR